MMAARARWLPRRWGAAPAPDPDTAQLRRVGWRLAALTVGLLGALLLVLGSAVYLTTKSVLLGSLQNIVVQRTNAAGPFLSRHLDAPRTRGDVSFVIADQSLNVLKGPDPFGPATLPDPTAARQVLSGRIDHLWSTQQIDATGPYLIYTVPVEIVQLGGTAPGVLQAYVSEQQYIQGLNALFKVLIGVAALGLLATTAISGVVARRALRPIQVAMRRQRDFVADAAHELRTPLAIMRTSTELGLGAGTVPEQQAALEQSLVQNAHLTRLVDTLSLLARADSGVLTLERQPLDLARLAAETAGGVEILAEEQDVSLRVEAPEETRVLGDAGRLRQLLLILLDNALKYTPPGGAITVGVGRQGGRARLQVRDTGPGIDPQDLPHLFDRFYRADRARTSDGMGLGLSIGRWIAEAHGGSITAANAPDGGALFTVTLPLAR